MEEFSKDNCDFSGWATRVDVRCSDGRTIRRGAFQDDDHKIVPLIWNHDHRNPDNVLGKALLEHRDDGVYAYCKFNDTESGKTAKKLVGHRDVCALSICANKLKQNGKDVVHGIIREVSLVLAGANPKAFIEQVMTHGEASEDEAIIYTVDEDVDDLILHSIEDTSDTFEDPFGEIVPEEDELEHADDHNEEKPKEDPKMAEPEKKEQAAGGEKTVKDVFDSMTEEQKTVVYAMIGQALEEAGASKGDEEMKHNAFENDDEEFLGGAEDFDVNSISHGDQVEILNFAKENKCTLSTAMKAYYEECHMDDSGTLQHGFEQIDQLFPEWYDMMTGAPEAIPENDEWVTKVMARLGKTPHSRIRTRQADVKGIVAGGYQKGHFKKNTGLIKLVKRTTDPQTIYIKDEMDNDDLIDITDFDVVNYQYGLMKNAMEEEIATDILIGDGREEEDEQKVDEHHIRPIWLDDELYTIHYVVDLAKMKKELQGTNTAANFGEEYIMAKAAQAAILYAREQYKGKGGLDFLIEPHLKNQMMLARDLNGRQLYETKAQLESNLDVKEIITIEKFAGKTRQTSDGQTRKLLGLLLNLSDYTVGMTSKGQITKRSQFDIDFNKEKYLMETRLSGALTRVKSAIALELVVE